MYRQLSQARLLRITSVTTNRRIFLKPLLVQRHAYHLPQLPKVPSKHELLQQARGFMQRLKVRIKYPLMKQMRPFNLNDMTAVFSWIFLGHTVWLLVGTTSFISFGLWAANSLQFQGKGYLYNRYHI
jgi:distribution and morphology protein 31